MSTTPPATTDPIPPAGDALAPALRSVETAPSAVVAEGPMLPRLFGFLGLFAFVLGAVVVVTTRAVGPRWVSEGYGFLSAGLGVALMLYHAVSDGEQEVRRMYGGLSVGLLVVAVLSALVPGPFEGAAKTMGYYLLPWGVGAGMLSLLFAVPFTRHETDEFLRSVVSYGMLGVGSLLCVGVVLWGLRDPDFLAGKGIALALLGLGFVCAYLGQVETAEGLGFTVAFALGAVGAAVAFYAFGRAVFPTVLYEGPAVLRKANQSLDYWRVAGRGLVILAFLGVAALGALGKFPVWLRAALGAVGLIGAGVFVAASLGTQVTVAPKPFLVPGGLILGGLGLAYLAVSLGICSDSLFVTLTRRELSAYFLSPIGYLVLAGMVLAEWLGYLDFVGRLIRMSAGGRGSVPEPIVQFYMYAIFPVFALTLMVPALTMRLFAEEKRSGTLEVMLTAPVDEWVVTLSKFVSSWLFFMVCWLPSGLFLLALKMESGQPFDYRPLLGFYVALAATGATFVAMGLFFSTITNNQIVAAVLTFVGMAFFLACSLFKERDLGLGQTVQVFLGKLAYLDLWSESLSGQLPIRDVILWVSLALFFVFLSIKVLETRRWS
ncbi:MAG: ABC transporter permease subunit [Planctomycetes bacterium]|nr:ABC transporter permease subunit [Planctomycetota bacterium]